MICEWLAFWKSDLRWAKCLALSEVAPQKRERLLMVAIKSGDEDLNSHICQSWPTAGQPSLQQFAVLTQVSGPFLDECASSDEVLCMYLDPSNLPRGTQIARQTKKSRVDVARYRLRSPQDQMSCLMANYSVGYELPNHTVQQGGLYGALLALPSGLRFCSTPEMYLLQLRLGDVFVPASRKKAIHIIGNSISTPSCCHCTVERLGLCHKPVTG